MQNLHCNRHADAEFVDRITLLAPPWVSAGDFGGAKIRAIIALSLGAVRPTSMLNLYCDRYADAEFVDCITLLALHRGACARWGWGVGVGVRPWVAGNQRRLPLKRIRICFLIGKSTAVPSNESEFVS